MPSKFLENKNGIAYKIIDFVGHTNIFIALCAASLTAYSQVVIAQKITWPFILITFSATLLLYNGQRMYLSFFQEEKRSFKNWYYKNKYGIILLMTVCVAGLYPLLEISLRNFFIYFLSFCLGIFYFLPFSNLRTIPVVKSFTVGAVWVLVSVVAPLEEYPWNFEQTAFCIMQLFLISALCVLFNIRDMEEDKRSGTYTVPVLFGIKHAKIFTYLIFILYLAASPFVDNSFNFFLLSFLTFLMGCIFTYKTAHKNHPFYYSFGVDGIILFQSIIGIFLFKFAL